MTAATLNFNGQQVQLCEQGADFEFTWTYEDKLGVIITISEYEMKMQVRKNIGDDLIVELSTDGGSITVDSNEEVTLYLTATETGALVPGKYVYDLQATRTGKVTRLLEGEFVIKARVTA